MAKAKKTRKKSVKKETTSEVVIPSVANETDTVATSAEAKKIEKSGEHDSTPA